MSSQKTILSSAYFPPIQYMSEILNSDCVIIEHYENYVKQSFRNRCEILSPNGKQSLSIPVIKKNGSKQLIKDVKIDNKSNWQSIHLKSIQTAYLSSPFFEFYIDAFLLFFKKKYTFLFDFNLEIIETLLSELQIYKTLHLSKEYINKHQFSDFRNSIHPKKKVLKNTDCMVKKYTQVFSDRFEFIPNLSILDLLFNEGPNTTNML